MFRLQHHIANDLQRKAEIAIAAKTIYTELSLQYLFFHKSLFIDSVLALISTKYSEPLTDAFVQTHVPLIEHHILVEKDWKDITVFNSYDSIGKLNFVHDTFFFVNS